MSRKAKTPALTEEERRLLTQINERGSDWRERRRARTVLLLDKGLSISAVVTEQKIHKETVACHRDAWLLRGVAGLRDLPRSGALANYRKRISRYSAPGRRLRPVRPPVEGPPVRGTWRTGFGGSGSGGLEREELCLEKDPAQSKKTG
ncbi:helix-turn-helix domain-containing protein [Accumulibacter sp.]|uniref:helix-turn-helix domain-containing protein n=1 Tax=Accumulibacter sp. TaxID=2053492 RepID=UPI003390408D